MNFVASSMSWPHRLHWQLLLQSVYKHASQQFIHKSEATGNTLQWSGASWNQDHQMGVFEPASR